ncbi:HNH endonuclease signature motif containing protein [Ruania zhangjianzhongii]|uniref:HNH endonuclease signature motif containing protein n=1 Tax=Ruania zhangjianzhongii TaxID=2603206 RepID=UPI0011C96881|nr:HNH endonuclease signature motif containing protein [Ruania zhangjianzhongii]
MTGSTIGADLSLDASLGDLLGADLPTKIAALEALCGAVSTGDIQDERDEHTGTELGEASVRVHRACSRLTGKRYQWLAVEETDGLWSTSTFRPRTFASYIAHTHGMSYGNARQTVRLARQLRDEIPQFGAALRAGEVGPDQVHAFAATALTSAARVAALDEQVELEDQQGPIADGEGAPGSAESPGQDQSGDGVDSPAGVQTQSVTVERFLLEQTRQMRPDQVRRLGKHFAQVADPEADDRGYRQAKEREYVELVRTLDGWHLSGFLTEENGRLVRTAMDAVMTPPAPDDQRTADQRRAQALADLAHLVLDQGLAGTHASVRPHLGVLISPTKFQRLLREAGASRNGRRTAPADPDTSPPSRTKHSAEEPGPDPAPGPEPRPAPGPGPAPAPEPDSEPRRPADPDCDSAADAAEPETEGRSTRHEPVPPRHRTRAGDWDPAALAELTTIDWKARLNEPPPMFDDGTGPVPPGLLRRLASCGDVYRVLFSPESEVINQGRTHRVFTPAQRRGLIARDRGCTWPGCTAPPSICESHHARVHWSDGGPTDLTNGALLCYHHHTVVDARSISMTRQDGVWIFTRPDGTLINTDRHESAGPDAWSLAT